MKHSKAPIWIALNTLLFNLVIVVLAQTNTNTVPAAPTETTNELGKLLYALLAGSTILLAGVWAWFKRKKPPTT